MKLLVDKTRIDVRDAQCQSVRRPMPGCAMPEAGRGVKKVSTDIEATIFEAWSAVSVGRLMHEAGSKAIDCA